MRPRLALVILCGAFTVGAIAGCGGSSSGNAVASKSPGEIVAAASTVVNRASSVHVAGSIVSRGVPLSLDLHLVSGQGGRGQMSESGLTFRIVRVGQTVYIQGSPPFWRHFGGAAAVRVLSGRWLKTPATGQFGSLAQLTDMRTLMGSLLAGQGQGSVSNRGVTTVQGRRAVAVSSKAQGGTLYVAAKGQPYPIEIQKAGSDGGRIVFDRFNQRVSLAPPAHAIDISKLG